MRTMENAPQSYETDHDMALAMKPEMDVIAKERADAQPTGVTLVIDGEIRSTGDSRHFSEPNKNEIHAARKFYAESNAKTVKNAHEVINDRNSRAEEIASAREQIDALTREDALPRDEETIRKNIRRVRN